MTPKQRQCLKFIADATEKSGGVCPSYREIADHLGLSSKSGVNRLVSALVGRGFLYRTVGLHRSLSVTSAGETALKGQSLHQRQVSALETVQRFERLSSAFGHLNGSAALMRAAARVREELGLPPGAGERP